MADSVSDYRIRWANVLNLSSGHMPGGNKQRMCIAERRTGFLCFRFWWPVNDWRWSEASALRDVEYDRHLRSPLPAPEAI